MLFAVAGLPNFISHPSIRKAPRFFGIPTTCHTFFICYFINPLALHPHNLYASGGVSIHKKSILDELFNLHFPPFIIIKLPSGVANNKISPLGARLNHSANCFFNNVYLPFLLLLVKKLYICIPFFIRPT